MGSFGDLSPTSDVGPSQSRDQSGRVRVSTYYSLFETSFGGRLDEVRYFDSKLTGGGTFAQATNGNPSGTLTVGTASGDEVIVQSRRAIEYNKGHSQIVLLTGNFSTKIANRRQRRGYFSVDHGLYFEIDDTTMYVVTRSSLTGSVVNTRVAQSAWNVDTLDGTGPSGKTFDETMTAVFMIDFLWLGVKGVRFYIAIDDDIILVHTIGYANTLALPYMDSGMNHIRSELTNTGVVASTGAFDSTCASVKSEGEIQNIGQVRVMDSGSSDIAVTSTMAVLAGIRLNSSYLKGSIKPLGFKMLPSSGTTFLYYQVIYNPTLTSPTWSAAAEGIADELTNSPAYSGGSVIASGHLQLGNKNQSVANLDESVISDVFVGSDIDGNADALIIVAQTDTGTGDVFFGATYREFI